MEKIEAWRDVFRRGFAPNLPLKALSALAWGLKADDKRIVQGHTTEPLPLLCVADWPVECACPIGFTHLAVTDGATVGSTEAHFAAMCYQADELLGEPAACRWFLNWVDDTPRDEMRRELLAEVERACVERVGDEIRQNSRFKDLFGTPLRLLPPTTEES